MTFSWLSPDIWSNSQTSPGFPDTSSGHCAEIPVNWTAWTTDSHNLRSATTTLCQVQPSTTTTFAKRASRCSAPAVCNSLPKTVTLLLCLSPGWRHPSSPKLPLFPYLSSTLPIPSAYEVTTLWRYTFIIIIIFKAHQHKAAGRKTRLDITKLWLQRQFTLLPWCCGKKPHFLFAEPLLLLFLPQVV